MEIFYKLLKKMPNNNNNQNNNLKISRKIKNNL